MRKSDHRSSISIWRKQEDAMPFSDPLQREVWATVEELNRAWTQGRPERLVEFFHPDVVAITPAMVGRLESGADCVAGWTAYARGVAIHRWQVRHPLVRIHGQAAVVAYEYEIEIGPEDHHQVLRGRDLLFLACEGGRWWVVADQFSPMPG
jgi:ketosteroid isomerase-like protein